MGFWSVAGAIAPPIIDAYSQHREAALARGFEENQAAVSRQFSERMSSTAHQREMADLKAAGLNPILTATGGSGAAVPSSAKAAAFAGRGSDFSSSVSSALQLKRNDLDMTLLREQIDKVLAEQGVLSTQYNINLEEARKRYWEAEMAQQDYFGRKLEGEIDVTKWGEFFRYLDRALGRGGGAKIFAK